MNPVICLIVGVIIGFVLGYVACEKVSEQVLITARHEGLRQGRLEREWEVMRLWDRVAALERKTNR